MELHSFLSGKYAILFHVFNLIKKKFSRLSSSEVSTREKRYMIFRKSRSFFFWISIKIIYSINWFPRTVILFIYLSIGLKYLRVPVDFAYGYRAPKNWITESQSQNSGKPNAREACLLKLPCAFWCFLFDFKTNCVFANNLNSSLIK